MVCLRNICINTLQKGAKNDDDNNNNNNNTINVDVHIALLILLTSIKRDHLQGDTLLIPMLLLDIA
jgi:hypothetical protein